MATTVTRLMMVPVLMAGAMVAGMVACPEWLTGQEGPPRMAGASSTVPPCEAAVLLTRRIKQRVAIARQVVAGEMTLLEAASVFRTLCEDGPPVIRCRHWLRLPGRSEGEQLCRQVLLWVESELRDNAPPWEANTRMAELQQELASAIGRDGKVVLP